VRGPAPPSARAEGRARAAIRAHAGLVAALLALLAPPAALVACAGTGEASRPNLLLVSVDTLRADALRCYGGTVGEGICDLFAEGTRFRWAFSSAPYTAPAVASLLTSRYPAYHGVTQSALSYLGDDVETLTEVLERDGYTTAAFVSNPVLERGRNLGQGFAVYDQRMTRRERNRPGYAEREAAATTDAVLAWADVALEEPWFLWVHYQDPHGPYEPPGSRPPRRDPPGATRLPVLSVQSGRAGIPAYQALPGLFTLPAYRHRYRDEIRYLDTHLVRLVRELEARGRPPALLLTADHGEAFGEDDYYFAHGHSVGLDQIRVPLLYRAPEPTGARVVDTPVSLVDVAPTLLAVAGLPVPGSFQGRPLPVAGAGSDGDAPQPDAERAIYAEHGRRAAVIAKRRFYSRDRMGVESRDRDLGQELPWLPARVASLGEQDALPAYRAPDEDAEAATLDALLQDFLVRTRDRTGLRHEEVDAEVRERMRALGYVED